MAVPKITDYEIQEKLGAGSYATVYKARHKKTNTFHAIKCVQKLSLSKSATDNLVTEIRLLKNLSHKHIVGLTDFFWDEKFIYIVLEYCNAGNLSTYIRQRNVLPEATCKYFLRQLAAAVQYMRSNDISHFDLKPQNLLLTRTPNVVLKVADFGFAEHLELGESNYTLKGSPLYMAPEIVLKRNYDARADLWSIGVILYECLFGRAPYSSKTIEELMARIKKQERIAIPTNAKISGECEDLLTRLLQHDVSKRITFKEFFEHPFLDLKHSPNEQSLQKAVSLVTKAVEQDEKQNYKEAYHLYCKALQYFAPLIADESDAAKRQALRSRVISYINRAEEIKTGMTIARNQNSPASKPVTTSMSDIMEPNARFKQLYSLCSSSPNIQNGLDIGRQAELYTYERRFDSALQSFTSALSILVPLLNSEPKGERRTLLYQQVTDWMKEAESIKALLSAKNVDEEQKTLHNCSLQ
ncbi:unnamed protein product [Hermetia illucens]|uniref:Serine/threonine-protein kinase ULK3 n=1 Tax=Hermetia illucens TaxID=343691 RepID=A0A7R8UQ62_HERIL|nr:serine/threonine-protein kinase ULK3 isoform X2 [Hermetia illucens]CAD7084987.1 unnamed protein product [Hermetia illucens]